MSVRNQHQKPAPSSEPPTRRGRRRAGNTTLVQGEKQFVSHSSAFISISLDMPLLNVPFSRFFKSRLDQLVVFLKPLRFPLRSVAVEITRAPLFAGVGCLAAWLPDQKHRL